MSPTQPKIAVVICTVGRPDTVDELVPYLVAQTRAADRVVFAVTRPEDIGTDSVGAFPAATRVEVIFSEKGLPRQRNAGLAHVMGDCDIVVFFDDDFVPSKRTLQGIEDGFARWPDVNGMTGQLIADGINGPGFDDAQAAQMVREYDQKPPTEARILRAGLEGLYGCNMAFRVSAIGATRFDERLPLYGWQEDVDFAARVSGGRIKTDAFAGVHRGAKGGRETSGAKLGYSQLANPWYLWRKGSLSGRFALRLAARNMAANHKGMLRPEPWIDRKGRAAGNWRALWEIATSRAKPERILEL
ncbi:glycosyltransferase [Sulfitobacter sp.]|uniref:glycosyltransferase family 2 protein n=1 Tax=Sulfitobacter sp. TaxID=1903071 RepID=UPI00329700E7